MTRPARKPPLEGRFVVSGISGCAVLGAFDAVEFGDAGSLAFPDTVSDAVFLVLAAAEFAFDLDVGAGFERCGKFGELSPADDAVPFGAGFPLARVFVLPGSLGGYGEDRNGSALGSELEFSVLTSCQGRRKKVPVGRRKSEPLGVGFFLVLSCCFSFVWAFGV